MDLQENIYKKVPSYKAAHVLKLCKKYMPETREAKKNRLMEMAQQKKDGQEVKTKKPVVLKYGLNHVTRLLISQDVGKMGFRQISLNIYILYQK